MPINETRLESFQNKLFDIAATTGRMQLSDVFMERNNAYINELTLFMAHFNVIPNFIHEMHINCVKANEWFLEHYSQEIGDCYYSKRYCREGKKVQFDDIFYILYEDLIVDFDTFNSTVRFFFRKTSFSKIEDIIKGIHTFKERKSRRKPEIALLVQSMKGIETKSLQITKPRLSIADNYNDDFKDIHEAILRRLTKNNDKGLVLLHGKPGTGKTSYIRYLISQLKKDVIFLPPDMAGGITSPDLISILINNPNSVLVIEDAEHIIADREKDRYSPVSALLNLSDGLLSDCLNIQVICSFNTDISKVDSALMRKGRLIAKYEFKELDIAKTRRLSQKLGFTGNLNESMTVSAIYNQDEMNFQQNEHTKIGFRS